ncbi:MAG: nucleotidyltransferase family protein [Thermoleophilia bacterium]
MGGVAAVVLAAGAGSRFGGPKQARLLPHVLNRLRDAPITGVVVVLGAHPVDLEAAAGLRVVRCADWERGPGASLRAGLAELGPDVDAAVVVLADGPFVSPAAIERVVGAWREGAGDLVAASYDGKRSHPVALGRALWSRIPDDGGRALPVVLVPCDDLGAPGDVDTPDDLASIDERLRGEER